MTRDGHADVQPDMHEHIHEADPFYIRTPTSLADERHFALKHNDTFLVVDRHGDMSPHGPSGEGLYHEGTRYLSRLSLRMGRQRPMLLSSAVRDDNAWIAVDLTNPDVVDGDTIVIARGTVHVSRLLVLWDGVLHEQFTIRNYGLTNITVPIVLGFDADYVDLFEVRGTQRSRRGQRLPSTADAGIVLLGYRGLDGVTRRTRVVVEPSPSHLGTGVASFTCDLAPQAEMTHEVAYVCEQTKTRQTVTFSAALKSITDTLQHRRADGCEIVTSNQQFNEWVKRSVADLSMMISDTPSGEYPYAGVPWFSTPFGRDGLITALECLWMNPRLARGVLRFLAATQATEVDPDRDAEPGKILHEMRSGEMAALGEIPFGRYYGSHDATPLFVMLAAAYYHRTADRALIEEIWPSIEAALHWIQADGDLDGDGFIEYARQSPTGLVQQGWKDSHDSVFHADGQAAEPPIALCEIQAYAYAAWHGGAQLAALLDHHVRAREWSARAEALRARFEDAFWDPELGTYALALDGRKRRCAVRASNAGQVLYTGIASRDRAAAVARELVAPAHFSGWGIRTLATGETRYNPMSYHNGSIWPHDNALVAAGFGRYGLRDEVLRVFSGLFDASLFLEWHRLPELFCGFARRPGESPTFYPVACNPQAWASGAVFLLLQAALGLEIDAQHHIIRFTRAKLPPFLDHVWIRNLRVGAHAVDLLLERHPNDVGINVQRRDGPVEIISIK